MNPPEPILPETDVPLQDPVSPVEEPPRVDDVPAYDASPAAGRA